MTDAMATGLAVALLLLCGLYWKIADLPGRLWGVARNELGKARASDDAETQRALQEAADARVGALVAGVRQYQQQIAADFRRQVADAELRARVAERNAADTTTALETATALVREVRATLDGLGELPALLREAREAREAPDRRRPGAPDARGAAAEGGAATGEPDDSRKTIEIAPSAPRAPAAAAPAPAGGIDDEGGWDDPEERTKVFPSERAGPTRRPPGLALRGKG